METFIEGLEQLETRLAIEALNVDFCHFLDDNRVDDLVDLFTEEARYSHGSRRVPNLQAHADRVENNPNRQPPSPWKKRVPDFCL
jgi:hypothetical protein